MRGTDGLKKTPKTAVLACIFFVTVIPGPILYAQESSSSDFLKSSVTTTEQPKPAPAMAEMDTNDRSGGGMISRGEMLTLGRCIDIALGKNPTIVAAVNTVDVSRNRVGEARANYYPQISASGGYSRTKPLDTSHNQALAYNQYTGNLTLNQTIYDFGKTGSSVNISKFNLDSSRSDLTTTQDTIILSRD